MEVAKAQSIVLSTPDPQAILKETDLLTNVREDLAELFSWWFDKQVAKPLLQLSFNRQGRMILCTSLDEKSIPSDEDIPNSVTEFCWKQKWFPREHQEEEVDFLKQHFGKLLDHDTPEFECVTTLVPEGLWETLALIVLFDAVPRGMHRLSPRTTKIFPTQHKAQHMALELVQKGKLQCLPLHFQTCVLVCLLHSTDPAMQQVAAGIIFPSPDVNNPSLVDLEGYLETHESIVTALKQMYRDNLEEMDLESKKMSRQSSAGEEVFTEE